LIVKGLSPDKKSDETNISPDDPANNQRPSGGTAEQPDVSEAGSTNPTADPTSKSQGNSGPHLSNVGNGGFSTGGEVPCEQKNHGGDGDGKSPVGNVGDSQHENPTVTTENLTSGKMWEGEV